jgi:excisionase family DNA binding protein
MANHEKSDNYLLQLILDKIEELKALIRKRKKPFLTIQEASEYLGISKNTLYGYSSKGILPFYKIRNRKIYFRISDLNKFVLSPENRKEIFFEMDKNNTGKKQEKKNVFTELDEFFFPSKSSNKDIHKKGKESEARKTK